jgi:hypothetical protein
MSQQFSSDAQQIAGGLSLPEATATVVIATNPLIPPFETCKAKVHASLDMQPDALTTIVALQLFRNPHSENLPIALMVNQFGAGAGILSFTIDGIDSVPDGRSVQYALAVTPQHGGGAGIVNDQAYIEATLISG